MRQVHISHVLLSIQHVRERSLDVPHDGMELGHALAVVQQNVQLPPVHREQSRIQETVQDVPQGRGQILVPLVQYRKLGGERGAICGRSDFFYNRSFTVMM